MDFDKFKSELRQKLEAKLGSRIGFEINEAAAIMGLSRKTLYNTRIGFRCLGKRYVGVDDILSALFPIGNGE